MFNELCSRSQSARNPIILVTTKLNHRPLTIKQTPTTDRLLTANVRKAIVGDKSLSTYAHNVKIIAHGGHVTLKGPVKSEQEKQQVFTLASSVVPAENISNELTVKE